MSDDPAGTGGIDALVIDALLSLGVDADEAMAMPHDARIARLSAAAADGDLPAERVDALRDGGVTL